MGMNNVDKLNLFIDKDKFANHVWHERGLNPSSPNLCKTLSLLLNQVAGNLKTTLNGISI